MEDGNGFIGLFELVFILLMEVVNLYDSFKIIKWVNILDIIVFCLDGYRLIFNILLGFLINR